MSTIQSTMSAAGIAGLAINSSIDAQLEQLVNQIELNQASSAAANKMNLAGSQATQAQIESQAKQAWTAGWGQITSSIVGGVAGGGLLVGELYNSSQANTIATQGTAMKADLEEDTPTLNAKGQLGDIEMQDMTPKPLATNAAGTVEGSNPNTTATSTAAPKPAERVKSDLELDYEKKAMVFGKVGGFLPGALSGIAEGTASTIKSTQQQEQAQQQAMAEVAQGLSSLLSKNADAATTAQQTAQANKDALNKAIQEMVLANRAM